MRDILHVDVDAFFASVEQVLDPALRGKPVIVGGNPDDRSVVASASYEARRYGVKSAMPLQRARRLCPDAVFVRGNFTAYGEFSQRIHDILLRFTPTVQTVSLDDFYLDLTGCRRIHGTPWEAAEKIKLAVRAGTELSVSIGVAANRMVAKVASDYAKPSGIAAVWPGSEEAFLREMPVEVLPGVGPSTAQMLQKYNLTRVGDIARLPQGPFEENFGPSGLWLWERAHGRDEGEVTSASTAPKSIGREHTFDKDISERETVRAMLYALTERAARQLREEDMAARRVTVKVRYADFKTVTLARTLPAPMDQDHVFYQTALHGLDRLLRPRITIRLVGVTLSGLTARADRQADLFAERTRSRRRRFYRSLDHLREKFGFDIAVVGPSLRMLERRKKERL